MHHDARGQQEQYVALKQPAVKKSEEAAAPKAETVKRSSSKLSYKLQRELEQLPQLLEDLGGEAGKPYRRKWRMLPLLSQPHEQTQKVLADMAAAEQELEQAFERWEYLEALKNGGRSQNSRFKQRQLTTVKLPDELGLSGMKTNTLFVISLKSRR